MSKTFVMHDTIDGEMVEVGSIKEARDYVKESYVEGTSMHPDFASFNVYEKVGEVFVQENEKEEATGIGYLIYDEFSADVQAREKSISFAEWIYTHWYKWGSDGLWWERISNTGGYRTEEMYNKFLQSQKIKPNAI